MSHELAPSEDPLVAQRHMQNLDVQPVVMNLAAIGRELDRLSREAAAQDEVVVRAYSAHRKAYAEAFTSGAGSVKDREQAAVLVCEPLKLEAELAEQVLRAMKERVKVLRDRLEIGRSVNAAIRTQFTTEGIGQS
jgi:hypothetical protein